MSAVIPPADWPANMSADDRKVWMHEQIAIWVGENKIESALAAAELGNLSHTQKAVAYRSILIIGSIRHCRQNKRAEARIPILTLITYLSDNAKGVCYLSIVKLMELLNRTRQCILDNIEALEKDGLIGVARIGGMPNIYWPRIPGALAEMSPNPVWFVDAMTAPVKAKVYGNVDEAIAAATRDRSIPVDQSTPMDRSSAVDRDRSIPAKEPVYSNQGTGLFEADSISSLYSSLSNGDEGSLNRKPHMSSIGFVISSEHKLIIPSSTVKTWQSRFSAILDLEAKLQRLAAVILKKGPMHTGWANPEAWMVGCLAEDNQKAIDAARITDAKVASAQRGQPAKTYRR